MTLGGLIDRLARDDQEKVVRLGLGIPHSYRGDYAQLAFTPQDHVRVGLMLRRAKSALGVTFEGWKGGEYRMDEYVQCYLAEQGECGEQIGPRLLEYMLRDAVLR
jgi:hypothetical protein